MNYFYVLHGKYDSPYGASTSLRSHISLIHSDSSSRIFVFFRFVPKSLSDLSSTLTTSLVSLYRLFFSSKTAKPRIGLIPLYFRFEYNFEGAPTEVPRFSFVKDLISLPSELIIVSCALLFRPPIIHFNSISLLSSLIRIKILLSVFSKSLQLILHVREHASLYTREFLIRNVSLINKAIFIEPTVLTRFNYVFQPSYLPCKVITNPFMPPYLPLPRQLNISADRSPILAYFGQLSSEKNTSILLDSYTLFKSHSPDSALILIGDPADNFKHPILSNSSLCEKLDIYSLASIPNLSSTSVYDLVDIFIRPDPHFMTGRTTYEALYSGCHLIMTGTKDEINNDQTLSPFSDRITAIGATLSITSLSSSIHAAASKLRAASPNRSRTKHLFKVNNINYVRDYLDFTC